MEELIKDIYAGRKTAAEAFALMINDIAAFWDMMGSPTIGFDETWLIKCFHEFCASLDGEADYEEGNILHEAQKLGLLDGPFKRFNLPHLAIEAKEETK